MRSLLVLWAAATTVMAAAVSITLDGDPPVVQVPGITAGSLVVTVDKPDAPPLPGATAVRDGSLTFTPRYRLQPGLAYRVRYEHGSTRVETVLMPRETATPTAIVERIFPSAANWPENTLRFYLHFSAPMARGEAFRYLHLIDVTNNREVPLPFLEIHEELWDRDQQRLTILFDPGRVKRGLVPHNEVGAPLIAGRRYRLVVDDAWRDARNQPLRTAFTKDFTATPAIREGIDAKAWRVEVPQRGTRDPLVVDFGRPLDAALVQRGLTVEGVPGEAQLLGQERRWRFTPNQPWTGREHTLNINKAMEDVAGNRLGRAFDVELDVFDRVRPAQPDAVETLRFTPRP